MIKLIFLGIGALIVLFILWRFYSERHTLPCPSWLSWMIELDNPFAPVHKATAIVANLDLKDGMQILDIGCGPGRVLIPLALANPHGHVTGLDIQAEMIEKSKEKAEQLGLKNISFVQGPLGIAPLPKDTFDRVTMVAMIGEIPVNDQQNALHAVFETVKPGGIVSVTEIIFDPHFQSKTHIETLMITAGFTPKATIGPWYAYTSLFQKP